MAKKKKKQAESKSHGHKEELELASFEHSLHELEEIVSDLESGNLSLADSLEKYESGIKNLKSCHKILQHAENRIRLLTGIGKDGTPVTDEFELSKSELYQASSLDDSFSSDDDVEDDDVEDEVADEESPDELDDSGTLF